MKKKIRCCFAGASLPNVKRKLVTLFDEYDVVIDEKNPDYVFFSSANFGHIEYNHCIKIFYTDENIIPNFNECDYAVGLAPLEFGDRYFRSYVYDLFRRVPMPPFDREALLKRSFCNFVYSNSRLADPVREQIYHALSKYKKIDSAGALLNNMGEVLPRRGWTEKLEFLSRYKFTLAVENSTSPGYVTEKILHPFLAHSLPIYWGCPNISSDYHPNSFVNLMDYSSIEEGIKEIIRLDQDDEAYLEKVMSPFWLYGDSYEDFQKEETRKLSDFYRHIFEQPLSQARRRPAYGHQGFLESWATRNYRNRSLKRHLKNSILNRFCRR